MNEMFFHHGYNPTLVLKINPIFMFVDNYLCLVLLGYIDGFLHSKSLIGWPLGDYSRRRKL